MLLVASQHSLRESERLIQKFLNLKTAKTLGVTIPYEVLLRADHVIE